MDSSISFNDSFFSCSSTDEFASAGDDSVVGSTLHDRLDTVLQGCHSNLNVVHVNAQSILGHYSDFLASFSGQRIDAILVSESFLKPSLPSTMVSLPGFRLIRNDRTIRGCGGVAIYLRADIPCTVISQSVSQADEYPEHLFLEICLHHTKLLLGVYYSPSLHINYFANLESLLELFSPQYDNCIIMGDFNTCLIKNDSRTFKLQSLISSVNFTILPLHSTHHAPHFPPSLLDLMIVSKLNKVAKHGQLDAPFSHHDLIYLSYKVRPPKVKAKYLMLRSFREVNLEALAVDVAALDWTPVTDSTTCDEMVNCFNAIVAALFDKHAPLKKVRVKHLPAPWLTPAIKQLMAKRDRAKRKHKKDQTDENFMRYKMLRNRCSRMCRDAKRRHIHESIDMYSPPQIWKFLKTLGIGKHPEKASTNVDLDALNKHFSTTPVTLEDRI